MISKLTGILSHTDLRYIILDVQGVGYKVYTTVGTLEQQLGTTVTFWTYLAVREDALDLYGFFEKEELELFELLITVSGIGPKTALGILMVANAKIIRRAVLTGDPSYMTKVSGIGKKNAEKIVLGLRDKLVSTSDDDSEDSNHHQQQSDSLEALKSLGYAEREAREALKKVPKDITSTAECVKLALKILARKD